MAILIVDDSTEIRLLLKRFLESAGYTIAACLGSGESALEYLDQNAAGAPAPPVELILMDIMMGGMTGIETCERIHSDPRFCHIPILMVTAQPEAEELQRCFAAGASDYVRKPVNRAVLMARVRQVLRLNEEIRQRKTREEELLRMHQLLQQANCSLKRLAALDGLTGIANRRRFDEHLEQEWRRCKREGWPLTVLVIDVDHFKRYNDTYGHVQGDECLRRVVAAVENSILRPGDLVARYGGEEFAVVLPKTYADGALNVAQRIRKGVASLQLPHAASPVADYVTVSLGSATCRPNAHLSPAQLLQDADTALYQAKSGGRNCVRSVRADELALAAASQ